MAADRSSLKQDAPAARIPPGERFGRARRVRSPRDFQRVRRSGRRAAGQYVELRYARRPEPEAPTRAGFSVSKRVGGAVVRNRVKRRLRESVRRALGQLAPGWDLILTARPAAAGATHAQLDAETRELLGHAGLWNAELPRETHRGEP